VSVFSLTFIITIMAVSFRQPG